VMAQSGVSRWPNRSSAFPLSDILTRTYLSSLPLKFSHKALTFINTEYRHALAAYPGKTRPVKPLRPYEPECTMSLQYSIPCRYTIYTILKDKERIRLHDDGGECPKRRERWPHMA